MKMIILQIVLLVLAVLYLLMAGGEKDRFNRASDCVTGVALFIMLYVSIMNGG